MGFLKKIAKYASLAAVPITSGMSLAPYAMLEKDEKRRKDKMGQRDKTAAVLLQQKADEENRRLEKEEDIAKRNKKTSGLASLMGGSGEDTLG